jgi:hypothetical protein
LVLVLLGVAVLRYIIYLRSELQKEVGPMSKLKVMKSALKAAEKVWTTEVGIGVSIWLS